jgi:tol-pal system protein YbgF
MIVLGVVLVAPPAYPQNTQQQVINSIATDVINLRGALKQLQESSDQRNTEMTKMMQNMLHEVLTRFSSMDASVKRLSDSFAAAQAGLKANDEKSANELRETRAALEALKKDVEEGFLGVQNQFKGVTRQLNDLKTVEQPLPSAAQMFSQANSDLSSGNYDLAAGGFTEFLRNHPTDERADDAAFYIGEALMAQDKLDQATVQFDLVLSTYPNSDKKCTALYRKGQILAKQKQIPDARVAYQNVAKECPGTQEAINATAALKTLPRG